MLIVGHGKRIMKRLNKGLESQFEIKALGQARQILGMNYISPKKIEEMLLGKT